MKIHEYQKPQCYSNKARPTRTIVAPSSMAASKSSDVPMDKHRNRGGSVPPQFHVPPEPPSN